MNRSSRIVLVMVLLVLSACQSKSVTSLPQSNQVNPVHDTPTIIQITPEIDTPTAVINSIPETPEISHLSIEQFPTPVHDPLRFSFPTPGPAPVSAWRPPLYPAPWAPTPFDHFYFSRPIAANEINWPLADYRYGGVFLPDVVHTGIDIPANLGTDVLAVGSGRVVWAGYGLYLGNDDPSDPYGLAITIRHDFGFKGEALYSVYGHLRSINVEVGQLVETGDLLGYVGQTGKVTGPHLHFEIRVGKNDFFVSRNPELWLAPPQGWGVLVARIMNTGGYPLESHLVTVRSKETRQNWNVKSYGKGPVVSDPYYRENMVLGDLPAGDYEVFIDYAGAKYNWDVRIYPGLVTYFTFRGKNGYKTDPPISPWTEFTPPSISPASSP
ncbi:MAG: peptidoglycan DD-metalloendopeptidase family protein [Anaerolineales bacterium]|nr:peptidoglycan DD-metalloendopeptidase family protein [Anaerolineales bacterium]